MADLAIIRIEVAALSSESRDDAIVALTARHKIPGILVRGKGTNAALVQGTTDLMYQRLMSGYVDRYRFGLTILLLFALIEVLWLLIQYAARYFSGTTSADTIISLLLLIALAAAFPVTIIMDNRRVLYIKEALTLVSPDHEPEPSALYTAYMRARNSRWVRGTLYILITVLLGVLSSKLADFIPFPWANLRWPQCRWGYARLCLG